MLELVIMTIKDRMNAEIAAWNDEMPGNNLPFVEDTEVGYRDVAVGARAYPALMIALNGGDWSDPYFSAYDLDMVLVVKEEDEEALNRIGAGLRDCLENVIRSDYTIGGLLLDSGEFRVNDVKLTGFYLINLTFNATMSLGSTEAMGGEDA